jgi:phosphatidylglycerophosphatase A
VKRSPAAPAPLGLRLAATFFFVGEAAPVAPATAASFFMIPFVYLFWLGPALLQALIVIAVIWFAVLVSTRAETVYGHDAKAIVIDEVAGMLVTFLFVPVVAEPRGRLLILLAGFVLFRIFDVLKPFPAGRAQRWPRGQGVVFDDVFAGVYANVFLRIGTRVLDGGLA